MKKDIINFWFNELTVSDWFKKSDKLDKLIADRFGNYHHQAIKGELHSWRTDIEGRLAEIIILDQFSRNLFRDDPRSFQYDAMALTLAQEAIELAELENLETRKKTFLFMPFMHSESLKIHETAVELFSEPGLENNLNAELKHKTIIERFGRYPHRNKILNRASTPEEEVFLKTPGSSF
ncbi:MAG: DUF924 domain-containing protein [Saccharospirillaceae bacterium]|nr:DUF924 domain-containing protein [Pseudomonadales bacterium]NRB80197.1 DUF924 domain-containing protein [Saccharospirillaceae bacterium]